MFEKIRKLKDRKGFTLVELIVVLVILAILAALLIPALTGYIDKANKEKVIAEWRMAVMAVQTESTTIYGAKGKVVPGDFEENVKDASGADITRKEEVRSLAEVSGNWTATVNESGKVVSLIYENANWHVEYTASSSTEAATYSDPVQQAQAIEDDTYVAPPN